MRPTFLQFRDPREKTPDFYNPSILSDGSIASLNSSTSSFKKGCTVPKTERFLDYKERAKRTPFIIGPGTYGTQFKTIQNERSKGTPLIKHYFRETKGDLNAYYYVNNILVYDKRSDRQERKSSFANANNSVYKRLFYNNQNKVPKSLQSRLSSIGKRSRSQSGESQRSQESPSNLLTALEQSDQHQDKQLKAKQSKNDSFSRIQTAKSNQERQMQSRLLKVKRQTERKYLNQIKSPKPPIQFNSSYRRPIYKYRKPDQYLYSTRKRPDSQLRNRSIGRVWSPKQEIDKAPDVQLPRPRKVQTPSPQRQKEIRLFSSPQPISPYAVKLIQPKFTQIQTRNMGGLQVNIKATRKYQPKQQENYHSTVNKYLDQNIKVQRITSQQKQRVDHSLEKEIANLSYKQERLKKDLIGKEYLPQNKKSNDFEEEQTF